MPKIERNIYPGSIHHVYNRGVNKQKIFYINKDYNRFLERVAFLKSKYNVKILAYSLLPNHFHFLLQEPNATPGVANTGCCIGKFIMALCNSHSKYLNISKERIGPLFQNRFKSKIVKDQEYLITLIAYINLNALKHKLVKKVEDWDYTSHHDYIFNAKFNLIKSSDLIDTEEYHEIINIYLDNLKELDEEF